ncbi:hypothetical protein QR680_010010 [Steinernema hermaphroditum]|nr:hypothetical protein QR680_010010 [Steinernema hermaphroditum]
MDSVPVRFIEQVFAYFTFDAIKEAQNVPGYYAECAQHLIEKKYCYSFFMDCDEHESIVTTRWSSPDSSDTLMKKAQIDESCDVLNRNYPPMYCGDIVLHLRRGCQLNTSAVKEFLRRVPYTNGITLVVNYPLIVEREAKFIEPFIESFSITGLSLNVNNDTQWAITKKLIEKRCLKNVENRGFSPNDEKFDQLFSLLVQPQFRELSTDVAWRNLDGLEIVLTRKIYETVRLHRYKVSRKRLSLSVNLRMKDWALDEILAFEELKKISKSWEKSSNYCYIFVF